MNQDNFICDGRYMNGRDDFTFPITGHTSTHGNFSVIGIFDGMGGEECGDIASRLAAEEASRMICTNRPAQDLLSYCQKANERIWRYAADNKINSMGTTAAILAFTHKKIVLCNIGDSRIYQFADGKLTQISFDHVTGSAYGRKPLLSQNLGIPPTEMMIEPYIAQGSYNNRDIYLICSDGLTDMLPENTIKEILLNTQFEKAAEKLLKMALTNGGKDNITMILCRIEKIRENIFSRLFRGKI